MEHLIVLSDLTVDARIILLDPEHYEPRHANNTLVSHSYFESDGENNTITFEFNPEQIDIRRKFAINGNHLMVDTFVSGRFGRFGIASADTIDKKLLECSSTCGVIVPATITNLNPPHKNNVAMILHLISARGMVYLDKLVITIPEAEATMLFSRYKKYRAQTS